MRARGTANRASPPTMNTLNQWFGLQADQFGFKRPEIQFGARCIFHPNVLDPCGRVRERAWLDFVHDRLSWDFGFHEKGNMEDTFKSPDVLEFQHWLNRTAIPALNEWSFQCGITLSSSATFVLDQGRFHFRATPNASHGYLYIGAWKGGEL